MLLTIRTTEEYRNPDKHILNCKLSYCRIHKKKTKIFCCNRTQWSVVESLNRELPNMFKLAPETER